MGAHICRVCSGHVLTVAISKARLIKFGLVDMSAYYAERRKAVMVN